VLWIKGSGRTDGRVTPYSRIHRGGISGVVVDCIDCIDWRPRGLSRLIMYLHTLEMCYLNIYVRKLIVSDSRSMRHESHRRDSFIHCGEIGARNALTWLTRCSAPASNASEVSKFTCMLTIDLITSCQLQLPCQQYSLHTI
jgi:hypothetical protein